MTDIKLVEQPKVELNAGEENHKFMAIDWDGLVER